MRNNSFWSNNLSFLDKIFFFLRRFQLRNINFNNKIIVDFGSGYNANFLQFLKKNAISSKLIAYDLNLNTNFLSSVWIESIKWDLNKSLHMAQDINIATCTAVLEHLDKPVDFLTNVYKLLSNNWILILTVPSIRSKLVLEFLAYKLRLIDENEIKDHKMYYNKKILLEYLEKAWFKKDNIKHSYFEIYMNNLIIAKK